MAPRTTLVRVRAARASPRQSCGGGPTGGLGRQMRGRIRPSDHPRTINRGFMLQVGILVEGAPLSNQARTDDLLGHSLSRNRAIGEIRFVLRYGAREFGVLRDAQKLFKGGFILDAVD